MKIGFVGCGKLGLTCASVFAQYYDVIGYDIRPQTSSSFPLTDSLVSFSDRDFIFIAVQTPHAAEYDGALPVRNLPLKDFDYSYVKNVLKDLQQVISTKTTIVLISTVLPGTIRNELKEFISERFIYNPYLIAMGTVEADMRSPEMIILGTADGQKSPRVEQLLKIYEPISGKSTRIVLGTWEEAESVKIFYNTFISAKIAIVNMIQDVAQRIGHINVDVVTTALAESTKRLMSPMYMKAGMGDGGPCHPRDNIALRFLAEKLNLGYDLFDAIIESREKQAENLAQELLRYGRNIIILGKGYKPNSPLIDGSYSLLVGHFVTRLGGTVQYYDPHTGDTTIMKVEHPVYLLGYIAPWVLAYTFDSQGTIVDPWRSYMHQKNDQCKVVYYGNTR